MSIVETRRCPDMHCDLKENCKRFIGTQELRDNPDTPIFKPRHIMKSRCDTMYQPREG